MACLLWRSLDWAESKVITADNPSTWNGWQAVSDNSQLKSADSLRRTKEQLYFWIWFRPWAVSDPRVTIGQVFCATCGVYDSQVVEFVLFFSQGISHWTAKRCEGLSLNIFGDNRRNDVSSTSLQAGYFPLYGVCWWVLPIFFPADRQKAYLVIPPSSIKKINLVITLGGERVVKVQYLAQDRNTIARPQR